MAYVNFVHEILSNALIGTIYYCHSNTQKCMADPAVRDATIALILDILKYTKIGNDDGRTKFQM